eukprot:17002-Chlamydomonas_euryale.AAC.2
MPARSSTLSLTGPPQLDSGAIIAGIQLHMHSWGPAMYDLTFHRLLAYGGKKYGPAFSTNLVRQLPCKCSETTSTSSSHKLPLCSSPGVRTPSEDALHH